MKHFLFILLKKRIVSFSYYIIRSPLHFFSFVYLIILLTGILLLKYHFIGLFFGNVSILIIFFGLIGKNETRKKYLWIGLLILSLLNIYAYSSILESIKLSEQNEIKLAEFNKKIEVEKKLFESKMDEIMLEDNPDYLKAMNLCIEYEKNRIEPELSDPLNKCINIQLEHANYIIEKNSSENDLFIKINEILIPESLYLEVSSINANNISYSAYKYLHNFDIRMEPCYILIDSKRALNKFNATYACENLKKSLEPKAILYNFWQKEQIAQREREKRAYELKQKEKNEKNLQAIGSFIGNITNSLDSVVDSVKEPYSEIKDEIMKGYNQVLD